MPLKFYSVGLLQVQLERGKMKQENWWCENVTLKLNNLYAPLFLPKVIILNAVWYAASVPGTEQHYWKNWWNPNKAWSLVNSDVLMLLVSQFWQIYYGKMLTIEEIGSRVYVSPLYYLCDFSVNLK